MEKVKLSNKIKVLKKEWFYKDAKINEFIISDSVEEIEKFALSSCKSLKEITIPSNVKKMRRKCFL